MYGRYSVRAAKGKSIKKTRDMMIPCDLRMLDVLLELFETVLEPESDPELATGLDTDPVAEGAAPVPDADPDAEAALMKGFWDSPPAPLVRSRLKFEFESCIEMLADVSGLFKTSPDFHA